VSRLLTGAAGEPFATGQLPCSSQPALPGERLTRLFLQVEIAGVTSPAVVDTGAAYLIVDPTIAGRVGLQHAAALDRDELVIRGFRCRGSLHRVPVTLVASDGESLTFEATAFLPETETQGDWTLPSFLGWQGCLERIRFAVARRTRCSTSARSRAERGDLVVRGSRNAKAAPSSSWRSRFLVQRSCCWSGGSGTVMLRGASSPADGAQASGPRKRRTSSSTTRGSTGLAR
jgi:hypothetical protein